MRKKKRLSPPNPSPTTVKPIMAPPVNATRSATNSPSLSAACVVQTFASVAMAMPPHPAPAERSAPARNNTPTWTPSIFCQEGGLRQ
mmetsp:Transcript_60733/g.72115  ORF Transcript_60733/g.72115 Transcript_60733/m.72115 type:complete len:87 (+) Transcript_60733:946-1206(+)